MKKHAIPLFIGFIAVLCLFMGIRTDSYADSLTNGSAYDISASDVSGAEATETDPYEGKTINIYYDLNDGFFPNDVDYPEEFLYKEEIELPKPVKQGYYFDGWYLNKGFTSPCKNITDAYILSDNEENEGLHVRLYAKWEVPVTYTPDIQALRNPAKGLIEVRFDKFYREAAGYQLQYSTDETFETKVHYKDLDNLRYAFLKNKTGQKAYFIRIRSYVLDSVGERVYSEFGPKRVIYVFNGTDEIEPSRENGMIHSAVIEGGSVVVTAEVPERTAGADDNYYIVKLDPISEVVTGVLSSAEKEDELTMTFPVSGNLMAKFALAVMEDETNYTLISPGAFIDNPEALASYTAPYPTPASKKGRQGSYDTGLGDKHYFHNLYIEQLIGTAGSHDVAYNYNGKTYYFYNPTHYIDYNSSIRAANANGGTVTMQLMIRWGGNSTDMICPTGRTPGYNYYAFNMEEPGGREKVEACFMFLAEYWSKPNLHVDNWILGNEVNTFLNTTGRWYWAGNVSRDTFMTNYSNTFRCLYYAVKSHSANSRVFTCTDHTWNDRDRDWGTRGFITALDSYLDAMNPHIQWNLANHAYTAVLTNADPWNDGNVRIYSVAHSVGASFVSPYNLEVLTNFVKNNFGSDVRIILSEVGFSYTNGTNPTLNGGRQSGMDVQAAATAYLYYKAHFTSNIDACIFHTGDEGEPGKNFRIEGLPAGDVYTFMDTPSYAEHTNQYLGLINGATSWEQIIPGFNGAALQGMPSR